MTQNTPEQITPSSTAEWRKWLQENHEKAPSVWLVYYKKEAGKATLSWSEAVDEALCFGWIDSTRKSLDAERFMQFFTRRKVKSSWSKINKEKVEQLIAAGKMTKAGLESIEKAKENGSWTLLDAVEELTIPGELETAFTAYPGSRDFFLSLSKSVRKMMLHWVTFAKREETRQKRAHEIAEHAGRKQKPKQFS